MAVAQVGRREGGVVTPLPQFTASSFQEGMPILTGLDSLYVGYYLTPIRRERVTELAQLKAHAKLPGQVAVIELGGIAFQVKPAGRFPYEYVLHNDLFDIALADTPEQKHAFPTAYVQFNCRGLWQYGARRMADDLLRPVLLDISDQITEELVSRADVTADFRFAAPPQYTDVAKIVTRAVRREAHLDAHVHFDGSGSKGFSGFTVGKGDILCRIYDKAREIRVSSKAWFYELWGIDPAADGPPVWRVEFQYRREALKQFGVQTIADLLEKAAGLWQYGTDKWLEFRELDDTNITRRSITPFWSVVKRAVLLFGNGVEVVRRAVCRLQTETMVSAVAGYATSLAALYAYVDGSFDHFWGALGHVVRRRFRQDRTFSEAVRSKRAHYQLQTVQPAFA